MAKKVGLSNRALLATLQDGAKSYAYKDGEPSMNELHACDPLACIGSKKRHYRYRSTIRYVPNDGSTELAAKPFVREPTNRGISIV
jgi:hypothetical protein